MRPPLFDTHTHLLDPAFDADLRRIQEGVNDGLRRRLSQLETALRGDICVAPDGPLPAAPPMMPLMVRMGISVLTLLMRFRRGHFMKYQKRVEVLALLGSVAGKV